MQFGGMWHTHCETITTISFQNVFILPGGGPPAGQVLPAPLPQPLAITHLFSVSMDVPIPDISDEDSHTVCLL